MTSRVRLGGDVSEDVLSTPQDGVSTLDRPAPSEPVPSEPVPSEPVPSQPTASEAIPSEPIPSEPTVAEPTGEVVGEVEAEHGAA